MEVFTIYTDGACSGNPGPGGWAAIINPGINEQIIYGGAAQTTNNIMELIAAIEGIKKVSGGQQARGEGIRGEGIRGEGVRIFTDSQYVQKGITEWINNWRAKDWKTASNKPVKNVELWKALDALCQQVSVSWHWIRGHDNDDVNERADKLARAALEEHRPTN